MRGRGRWMLAVLITVGLAMTGCSKDLIPGEEEEVPARVEAILGTDVKKVTLTERAFIRLGIQTVVIGAPPSTVPYSAVMYDPKGGTWVYTVPQPRTYLREKVVISTVNGTSAVLSQGPPAGTVIVSTGVVELYGAELGVGE